MNFDRRLLLSAGMLIGAGTTFADAAGPRQTGPRRPSAATNATGETRIQTASEGDRTATIQAAIDRLGPHGGDVVLQAGRHAVQTLTLRPGVRLRGEGDATLIVPASGVAKAPLVRANAAHGAGIEGLVIDGGGGRSGGVDGGLVELAQCRDIRIERTRVQGAPGNGLVIEGCSGRVSDCDIRDIGEAAIRAVDSAGLAITGSRIADCANNGILVWRTRPGDDDTIVDGNRIERIAARRGGSGQYGNGINVFRADGVLVTGNRIADCAYSAVRGNAASNIQIVANACSGLGEVAIYAEFGFQGALIASNVVDGAGTGISVTNFNEGGRLAVIQGNLVRNLRRREFEPVDKRGEGIAVEADAAVTGNVVEAAPTAGLVIGWGPHMREVAATGNVIRRCGVGIMITADPGAGACMVAQNLISGSRDGAIRAMDHGRSIGPDLARSGTTSPRIAIVGNLTA